MGQKVRWVQMGLMDVQVHEVQMVQLGLMAGQGMTKTILTQWSLQQQRQKWQQRRQQQMTSLLLCVILVLICLLF